MYVCVCMRIKKRGVGDPNRSKNKSLPSRNPVFFCFNNNSMVCRGSKTKTDVLLPRIAEEDGKATRGGGSGKGEEHE